MNGVIRRGLSFRHCDKCNSPILVGLDSDLMALVAIIDPATVTDAGEALGLLASRLSYTLRNGKRSRYLDPRSALTIAAQPAHLIPVVLSHNCDRLPASCYRRSRRLSAADMTPPY